MIKISIISPTKCYVENASSDEISRLSAALTYTDTSTAFALKKLNKNRWLKTQRPHIFSERKKELEAKLKANMLQFDVNTGKYWFYPGSISYLNSKFNFDIENKIKYPEPKKLPWKKKLPFDLYTYQSEAVKNLIEQKHGCVELCTGAGKSAIILTIARELGGLKTAIVTPSQSIFKEILHLFEEHLGKGCVGAYGDGKKKLGKNITVCISKSLSMIKPDTPEYDFFKDVEVVLGDESHTLAAETLESVFHGVLKNASYRFFLSGTQVRGDGKDKLLHAIIGKKVGELTTKQAIKGKFICPVKFYIFEVNPPNLPANKKIDATDAIECKRYFFLRNENIANIAAKIANSAWNIKKESTLILVEELEQIKMITDKLTVPFEYAHSASKKDAEKAGLITKKIEESVESFNTGKAVVLIGTSCISTGTNIFPTHNTVNWVGGSSEVKTKQGAVGRSVRLLEKSKYKQYHSPKPCSKIYDFRVLHNDIMENHLQKRIAMYEESLEDDDKINFIKSN